MNLEGRESNDSALKEPTLILESRFTAQASHSVVSSSEQLLPGHRLPNESRYTQHTFAIPSLRTIQLGMLPTELKPTTKFLLRLALLRKTHVLPHLKFESSSSSRLIDSRNTTLPTCHRWSSNPLRPSQPRHRLRDLGTVDSLPPLTSQSCLSSFVSLFGTVCMI